MVGLCFKAPFFFIKLFFICIIFKIIVIIADYILFMVNFDVILCSIW